MTERPIPKDRYELCARWWAAQQQQLEAYAILEERFHLDPLLLDRVKDSFERHRVPPKDEASAEDFWEPIADFTEAWTQALIAEQEDKP